MTIDTGGSTFASALAVFSGRSAAAFNPAAPVLPTNVVACDRNTDHRRPGASCRSSPSRERRYFLMAGVAPLPSSPSSGNLRLSMRVLDIETPVVTDRAR